MFGFQSVASIPLLSKGEVIGALNIISTRRHIIDEEEKVTLISIGTELGSTIERMLTERDILKINEELHAAYEEISANEEKLRLNLSLLETTEQELKKSEEQYRTLFMSSRDAIMVASPGQELLSANPAAIQLFACKNEQEFISHTPSSLSPVYQPDGALSSEKSRMMIQYAMENGSHFFEWTHRKMDGTEFQATVLLSQFEIDQKMYLQATVRDITDQKEVEYALIQAHEKLRRYFDANIIGIILGNPLGDIIEANDYYLDMIGYTREEFEQGMVTWRGLTPPEWLPADEYAINELREKGVCTPYEKEYFRRDGTRVPVYLSDAMLAGPHEHIVAFVLDITDLKKAEQSLRESEEKNRILIEGISDPIFTFTSEGRYSFANHALAEVFGKPAEEIIGRTIWDFFPKDEAERRFSFLKEVFITGESRIIEGPVANPRETRYYVTTITPIKNSTGEVISAFCSSKDITERKRVEDYLRESEERFRLISENSPDHIFIQDRDLRYLWVLNPQLGLHLEDMIGKTDADFLSKEDADKLTVVKTQILETGETVPFETSLLSKTGESEFFEGLYMPKYDKEGNIDGLMGYFKNTTKQKTTDAAFQALVRSMVGRTGMQSLHSITENISVWLSAECVMVGEIQPDGQHVNVLSMILDGKTIPDYSYDLKGTPCDDVTEKGFCLYPDKVIDLFPESRDLVDLNITGYAGTPLINSQGQTIGILCALFRKPIKNTHTVQNIMDIIAVKAAAEIERMHIMNSLRESEEKLALVMNGVPTLISYMDTELRFVYLNKAHAQWYGCTAEELIGRSLKDLLHDDIFSRSLPYYEKVLSGSEVSYENTARDHDGRERALHVTFVPHLQENQVVGFFAALEDITERKKIESALVESEERFRNLLQHVPSISVQGYNMDGTTQYWNDASEVLYGYPAEEAIGKNLVDLVVPPEMQEDVRNAMKYMAETGQPIPASELQLMRKDGSRISVFSSHAIVKRSGREPELFCIDIDLTEQKRAEEALHEANQKLRLLTGLTRHDIFNQLNTGQLFLDLALAKSESQKQGEYITYAMEANRRIESIIGFTREYENFGTASSGWLKLRETIESARMEIFLEIVKVENQIQENLMVYADPILRKVFTTLIENAARHGGGIQCIKFSCYQNEDTLIISCVDDGIGISLDEKIHIFEHGYGKHTGIGLFLAKEILSITGLSIRECGIPWEGARFEILVPKGKYCFM
jgi:PAS domain S-box-containing protein